jgi:hypothetical protein
MLMGEAMMEFLALWDWAAQELPAEPVGVAVLCLGDALVMGRFEDGAGQAGVPARNGGSRAAPGGVPS